MASQAYIDKANQRKEYRNLWHTDLLGTIQADTPCKTNASFQNYQLRVSGFVLRFRFLIYCLLILFSFCSVECRSKSDCVGFIATDFDLVFVDLQIVVWRCGGMLLSYPFMCFVKTFLYVTAMN